MENDFGISFGISFGSKNLPSFALEKTIFDPLNLILS